MTRPATNALDWALARTAAVVYVIEHPPEPGRVHPPEPGHAHPPEPGEPPPDDDVVGALVGLAGTAQDLAGAVERYLAIGVSCEDGCVAAEDECLATTGDADACRAVLDGCLAGCAPDPCVDACMRDFDVCSATGAGTCEGDLERCIAECTLMPSGP